MTKLSIVVPVYNIKEFLHECINSVLSQINDETQLLLIDDGSFDGSEKICDEYSQKFECVNVIHKKNEGVAAARNTGIEKCKGEFVWFLDADDFILDGSVKKVFSSFDSDADFYCYRNLSVSEDGKDFFDSTFDYPYVGKANCEIICSLMKCACTKCLFPYVWRNIYRKSFILKNNIHFCEELSYGEDSIFSIEAFLKAENIIFFEDKIIAYRFRSGSLSKNNSFSDKKIKMIELYSSLRDEKYEALCKHKYKEFYFDAGKYTVLNIYFYALLSKLYMSDEKNKYLTAKKITKLPFIREAFKRFDIYTIKSKSLDWLMFWAAKNRLYILVHIICKYLLFKNNN